jgi:hypothetical protein
MSFQFMTEHVIVTDAGGVRTIQMNRPDKKNALTLAMYEAMTAALESANASAAVRCVLIAGVPGAFSAGNDLTDFLKAAEGTGGLNRPALRFLSALVRCNKPMVAAVSGVASRRRSSRPPQQPRRARGHRDAVRHRPADRMADARERARAARPGSRVFQGPREADPGLPGAARRRGDPPRMVRSAVASGVS